MITLLFSKRNHPGSWVIRAVTWSEWSHVEIVLPDGRLLGAAAPHGVQFYSMEERMAVATKAAIMHFPGDVEAAMTWAQSQIGKPYDWTGVIGLGLHRDWEEDDKWWCSEFAGKFLKEGGFDPYRSEVMRRLVPQHLWMLNYESKVIKNGGEQYA